MLKEEQLILLVLVAQAAKEGIYLFRQTQPHYQEIIFHFHQIASRNGVFALF
jgi:hypothetical protein